MKRGEAFQLWKLWARHETLAAGEDIGGSDRVHVKFELLLETNKKQKSVFEALDVSGDTLGSGRGWV